MTLSSQMARTDRMSGSWGGSSRRRQIPPTAKYILAAAGAVLLGVGVWALTGTKTPATPDSGSPSSTDAAGATPPGPSAPLPSASTSGAAPDTLAKSSKPPAPPPSFDMSSRNPPGNASTTPDSRSAGTGVDIPRVPTTIPSNTGTNPRTSGPTLIPTPVETPTPTDITSNGAALLNPGGAGGGGDTKPGGAKPPANPSTSTPPATQTPPPSTPAAPAATPSDLQTRFAAAERAMKDNKLVEARQLLNGALLDSRTPDSDREGLRKWMAQINETLIFSPTIVASDPLVSTYAIAAGDSLVKVANKQGVATDWRFIQRVNKLSSPSKISVGQKLKLVRGPFHAVVHKSAFRMDIFAGEPNLSGSAPKGGTGGVEGVDPGWIYIRSFPVGLGTEGSTPTGSFIVRPRSKLVNPAWTNPRTGEKFAKDDPKNPIGEFWMGLEGIDDGTRALSAYGVHGTIAPESIGREMSMGCVRMSNEDIPVVYEMLTEGVSVVRIVP